MQTYRSVYIVRALRGNGSYVIKQFKYTYQSICRVLTTESITGKEAGGRVLLDSRRVNPGFRLAHGVLLDPGRVGGYPWNLM